MIENPFTNNKEYITEKEKPDYDINNKLNSEVINPEEKEETQWVGVSLKKDPGN